MKKLVKKLLFLVIIIFLRLFFYFTLDLPTQPGTENAGNVIVPMATVTNNVVQASEASLNIDKPVRLVIPSVKDGSVGMPEKTDNVVQDSEASLNIGKPVRLVIPSVSVDANILHIGLNKDGSVGVPEKADEVSWFDLGPRPGQKGSAVISGHYGRWRNGTNSVFNLLPNLKIGEKIYVKDNNGISRSFKVKKINVYDKDESVPEIFNKNDGAYLNIITCHGQWLWDKQTYSKRLVVFAQLDR